MVAAARAGRVRDATTALALLLAARAAILRVSDSALDAGRRTVPRSPDGRAGPGRRTRSPRTGGTSRRYVAFLAARGIDDAAGGRTRRRPVVPRVVVRVDARPRRRRPTRRRRCRASLSAVRSFHRFLVREGLATDDPASRGRPPARASRRSRTRCQRRRGPAPPRGARTGSTPTGLRDRAILELLYGAGPAGHRAHGARRRRRSISRTGSSASWGKAGRSGRCPLGRYAQRRRWRPT